MAVCHHKPAVALEIYYYESAGSHSPNNCVQTLPFLGAFFMRQQTGPDVLIYWTHAHTRPEAQQLILTDVFDFALVL